MLNRQFPQGIYVPVVTPFTVNGELDLDSFQRHVTGLITAKVHGLVINGTTGESPTLMMDEVSLITNAARKMIGTTNIPLIVGTGSNSTTAAVNRTEAAGQMGANAALVVVPYYNRPSQKGIIEHYRCVAEAGVPVIMYDIPQRTGVKVEVDTIRTIMDMEGVIGLKDSTGSTRLLAELTRLGCDKPVWCGDDELLFASLCCGATGGMVASANVYAERFVGLYDLFQQGRVQEAKLAYDELYPLIQLLFSEPNPAPVKWMLARQGIIDTALLRLPMTEISSGLQHKLGLYVN